MCSGHGQCNCGRCVCDPVSAAETSRRYTGTWCECNDYTCEYFNGQLCGGRLGLLYNCSSQLFLFKYSLYATRSFIFIRPYLSNSQCHRHFNRSYYITATILLLLPSTQLHRLQQTENFLAHAVKLGF